MDKREEGEIDAEAGGPVRVPAVSSGTPSLSDNGRTAAPADSAGVATLSYVGSQKRGRTPIDNHDNGAHAGKKTTSKQRKSQKRAELHAARLAGQTIVDTRSPAKFALTVRARI